MAGGPIDKGHMRGWGLRGREWGEGDWGCEVVGRRDSSNALTPSTCRWRCVRLWPSGG